MRARLGVLLFLVAIGLALAVWRIRSERPVQTSAAETAAPEVRSSNPPETSIYAHNLRLHQGPKFVIYVRWLRGRMARSHRNVNPSFDDPASFYLDLTNGVLRANLGDISNYLNSTNGNAPLKNITVTGQGNQMKLTGTLHKLIALPVELQGVVSVASNNRIHLHVTKINVLKIPFKALLKGLDIKVSDFFHSGQIPGIEVSANDIFFDAQTLLPPPHIRGSLSAVTIDGPDLQAVYGDAREDVQKTEQWRNFLRLSGGALNFGKLTMSPVDLIMIDISQDAWFDLDLSRYQEQLVDGYTRMTPQAGLQIFMPDLADVGTKTGTGNLSIQWIENRSATPPADVTRK